MPRSGKGGAVGVFEPSPFNEPHPLSQAVRPASSPIGEPSGLLRIRLGFYKSVGAYRETPQSALTGCQLPFQGRLSRCPLWGKCREAAKGVSLVFLSRHHSSNNTPSVSLAGSEVPSSLPAPPSGSRVQPPLKGLAGVAVPDGVQLLNAKLRTAHRAGGVSRGTQNTIRNAPRRIRRDPCCPLWGKCRAAAKGVTLDG